MTVYPAIPNPNDRTVKQEIFDAQVAIENWYVMHIRREEFRKPQGWSWADFSNVLVALRLRLSGSTAEEALPDARLFIDAMAEANSKKGRK